MKLISIFYFVLLSLSGLMPFTGFAVEVPSPAIPPQPNFDQLPNEPDDGVMKKKPVVEDLGNGRYRIGKILLDKEQGRFNVPGVVLPYEEGKPLEFIAVTKQGFKAYESLLELDVNAFEFNLACILIGLDDKNSVPAKFHFDPAPMQGDKVSIRIGWEIAGKRLEADPMDWLKADVKLQSPAVWIYSGSQFIEGNRYLAQMDGTLIGLVHDPASIIEHRTGLAMGNWGVLMMDLDMVPAGGTPIELSVQYIKP